MMGQFPSGVARVGSSEATTGPDDTQVQRCVVDLHLLILEIEKLWIPSRMTYIIEAEHTDTVAFLKAMMCESTDDFSNQCSSSVCRKIPSGIYCINVQLERVSLIRCKCIEGNILVCSGHISPSSVSMIRHPS